MVLNGPFRSQMRSESEFLDLISRHASRSFGAPEDEIGIGDDAALVSTPGEALVMTADAMIDGVHFHKGRIAWRDLGWKSIVSNQSDIAAMGAAPGHALVTLAITEEETAECIDELFGGMVDALQEYGGRLVGGDTVSSAILSVSIAMTGEDISASTTMRRDGASAGDLIAVTGPLGGSAGGLAISMNDGIAPSASESDRLELLDAHFRPTPRTDLVSAMQQQRVRCAIDISDGLLIDLRRLCTASSVDAVVHADNVPIYPSLIECFPDDWLRMALTGGEDYELIYAGSQQTISQVNEAQPQDSRSDFGVIGEFIQPTDGKGGNVTVLSDDGIIEMDTLGWDHFSGAGKSDA